MLEPTHHMTPDEYFSHPALNRSALTDLQRSPLHYWGRHVDPQRISAFKETPALRFGTACHMAVLEPERYAETYAEGPMVSRSSKAWKDAVAGHKGVLMPPDEMRAVDGVLRTLKAHKSASRALFEGKGYNEATFICTDKATGLELKCRADRVTENDVIVDLKTTQDASQTAFAKSVVNFGYNIQAAYYMHVIEQATGTRPKGFAIVAVEKEPPYACQVFRASDAMIQHGTQRVTDLLELLRWLKDEYGDGPWPSYSQDVDLPSWALK